MAGEKKKAGNSRLKAFLIVVIGIIVIISFQYYILPFVESIFPILKGYDRYLKDALAAIVIFSIAVGILSIVKRTIEKTSQKANGRNYRGLYTHT